MNGPRDDIFSKSESSRKIEKLTFNDAASYLKDVKETFQDKKEIYDELLDVLVDFKAHKISALCLITRAKELLKGHDKLLWGFSTFLPKGYEVTNLFREEQPQQQPPVKKPIQLEEALFFVGKVKTRFKDNFDVYLSFLEILELHRQNIKSFIEVYQDISVLFKDHADLLQEFTHFLPDTSASTSSSYPANGNPDPM